LIHGDEGGISPDPLSRRWSFNPWIRDQLKILNHTSTSEGSVKNVTYARRTVIGSGEADAVATPAGTVQVLILLRQVKRSVSQD
jgi:hypothetical protein